MWCNHNPCCVLWRIFSNVLTWANWCSCTGTQYFVSEDVDKGVGAFLWFLIFPVIMMWDTPFVFICAEKHLCHLWHVISVIVQMPYEVWFVDRKTNVVEIVSWAFEEKKTIKWWKWFISSVCIESWNSHFATTQSLRTTWNCTYLQWFYTIMEYFINATSLPSMWYRNGAHIYRLNKWLLIVQEAVA